MKYVQISADKLRVMHALLNGTANNADIASLKKYVNVNLAEFDSMNRELQEATKGGNVVSIENVYKVKCNMTETYCQSMRAAEEVIDMHSKFKDSRLSVKYLSAKCLVEILKMVQGNEYDSGIIYAEVAHNGCKDFGYAVNQRFLNGVNRILNNSYLETNMKESTAIVKQLLREHEIVEFCRYSNYIKRSDIDKLMLVVKKDNDVIVKYGKGDMGHTLVVGDMVMRGLKLEDIRDELLDLI